MLVKLGDAINACMITGKKQNCYISRNRDYMITLEQLEKLMVHRRISGSYHMTARKNSKGEIYERAVLTYKSIFITEERDSVRCVSYRQFSRRQQK